MTPNMKFEQPLSGYDRRIGGSAGDGMHGGTAVSRPDGMPTRDDATHTVSNKSELLDAVQINGATVWLDRSVDTIDVTGAKNVWMGNDVTLVGGYCDPSVPGRGPVIKTDYYHRHLFRSRGPVTLYGVSMRGPNTEYFDPRERAKSEEWNTDNASDWYSSGIHLFPGKNEGECTIIGCEFFGWTLAGVELGAKGYETTATVKRCSFHDSPMETAGYGIEHYNGSLTVSRSFFDSSRHGISGFGYPTETIQVTDSIFGPGPWSGHALDMHCLANNLPTKDNTAGRYLRADCCTFMGTEDIAGYDQEGIAIRGISVEQSHVRDSHFYHPDEPAPTGDQGSAYRQEVDGGWRNFQPSDNHFGESPAEGYGAPRAQTTEKPAKDESDKQTEQPSGTPSETSGSMRLTIHGRGISGEYELVISGTVKQSGNTEGNDSIEDLGDNRRKITGGIVGAADSYELGADSTIERAWFTAPARVTKNGEPIDTGPLVAAEANRRLNEQSKRVDQLRSWVTGRLDSLDIVVGGGSNG